MDLNRWWLHQLSGQVSSKTTHLKPAQSLSAHEIFLQLLCQATGQYVIRKPNQIIANTKQTNGHSCKPLRVFKFTPTWENTSNKFHKSRAVIISLRWNDTKPHQKAGHPTLDALWSMFNKKQALKSHLYKPNYILMTWTDVVASTHQDRLPSVILYINKLYICTHSYMLDMISAARKTKWTHRS
jgi:hypothetical protein